MDVDEAVYDGVAQAYAVLAAINTALWCLSLLLGKTWPVDFIWSSWPIAHAAWLIATAERPPTARSAVVVALVTIWGLRLTSNFVRRGGIGHVRPSARPRSPRQVAAGCWLAD
jgi:steroid 5-alpha reductase family enzyme